MKILVAGSTGMIGSALVSHLKSNGHEVVRLVRRKKNNTDELTWDPYGGSLPTEHFDGVDAVINLCGDNISSSRWTEHKKQKILQSRIRTSRLIADTLCKLENPPKVFLNASAVGYYGNKTEKKTTEKDSPGEGFLAKVCQEWEAATESAIGSGARVVNLRTGVVLSKKGGALGKMLLPFKLGLGGVIGSGKQMVSWIAIDDLVRIILHCLVTDSLRGPVNAVTPYPVTNRELTKTLGSVLKRPTILPMPAFAARLVFGEMADELLLCDCDVYPEKLLQSGYAFELPHLKEALKHLLKK